jgi:predicted nucleic acid-binding protein
MLTRWKAWIDQDVRRTVPAVVVAEWWRSARGPFGRILRAATVEPVDDVLARIAGEALAEIGLGREHTIDAIVMASAAQRGDVVYTSDFEDLMRLAGCFPAVRVLGV